LNNKWVIEEIRKKIFKTLESNEHKNTTYWSFQDMPKAVKFIAMSAYINKSEKSQINNLMLCFKD
jgi:hypothetical protein